MFSKASCKGFLLAALAGLLLAQTACDRFLKASNKNDLHNQNGETVDIPLSEVSCLKKISENLQKFFDDQGGSQPLSDGISCIQSALRTFMKYTRGTQPDSYTGKEFQYLFNKYLLKNNQISDQFQKEIVKIKVIAVGGSAERVTRAEIHLLIRFLDMIQAQGAKLQGRMRLLSLRQTEPQVDGAQIQATQKIVQEVAAHILAQTKVSESHYQWTDLISFVNEFHHFLGESESFTDVLRWVPLAESLKQLFVAEENQILTERQWAQSMRWVVDTYALVLKFHYEIRRSELETPGQWESLVRWIDEGLAAIEMSPIMTEKKLLEARSIDHFLDEIDKLKLFQSGLSMDLVKANYRKVLVHLIEGKSTPLSGLSLQHFQTLQQEYQVWKLNQIFLNEIFKNNLVVTNKLMVTKAQKRDPMGLIKSMTGNPLNQKELQQSWIDFLSLLNSSHPIVYNSKKKVMINNHPEFAPFSFAGANLMNFIYSITRLTLRGYGEPQTASVFSNRISQLGLIQFEKDFRELGQRIGFLDPRNTSAAAQTFIETNSFAFHGNGDQWISAIEIFEELNLLVSGGRMQVEAIMTDLEKRKCLISDLDIFGRKWINETCFVSVFRENWQDYFDNMISMGSFIAELNEKDFSQFYDHLKVVSQLAAPYHQEGRLEYTEIRNMTAVLHYIEALMAVYDKDLNGLLSKKEAILAVPRFSMLIKSVSPLGDFFVEDIFLYLVYKGRKPTGIKDLISFKFERLRGLGEVDRLSLIKVLGVLKNDMK